MFSIDALIAVNSLGQGQPTDAKVHVGINSRNRAEASVSKISLHEAISMQYCLMMIRWHNLFRH